MTAPPVDGQVERILAERARALATPLRSARTADAVELVVVRLGAERYGLDSGSVVEVLPLAGLAAVPGLPPPWVGIVNVRGCLYPVLDLGGHLGLPPDGAAVGPRKVALVTAAGLTVALLVDDALEIRQVPAARIGPPLAGSGGITRAPVRGVTPDLLTVLDVAGLLADPRLVVREEAT